MDSEQYELYEKLEKIELTDTVSVYIPEYDVDVLVKITELKYDSLRERTISIVAGSSGRTSLMDEISGSYKKFTTTLVDDKIQSATAGIVNQILTQKNGVNMFAGRATPPDNAKKGDIWFKDVGSGDVELYEFDGVNWIRKMYKGFGEGAN
jgi:phage-related protein